MVEGLEKHEFQRAWSEATWRNVWNSMGLFLRILLIGGLSIALLALATSVLSGNEGLVLGLLLLVVLVALVFVRRARIATDPGAAAALWAHPGRRVRSCD